VIEGAFLSLSPHIVVVARRESDTSWLTLPLGWYPENCAAPHHQKGHHSI